MPGSKVLLGLLKRRVFLGDDEVAIALVLSFTNLGNNPRDAVLIKPRRKGQGLPPLVFAPCLQKLPVW